MKPLGSLPIVAAAAIGLLGAGCSAPGTEDPTPDIAGEAADVALGPLLRGTILAGESPAFRLCGDEASLPLYAVDLPTRDLLDDVVAAGEPVYAELRARRGGRVPGFTMTRLHYAAIGTTGCEGPAPDFVLRGQGNEPFWSLTIEAGRAIWTTPEIIDGEAFTIARQQAVGEGWLLEGSRGEQVLRASFAATPCRDSMADAWYGFTVQVERRGEVVYGCGRAGSGLR
jgi:uncharacterized membrane protein